MAPQPKNISTFVYLALADGTNTAAEILTVDGLEITVGMDAAAAIQPTPGTSLSLTFEDPESNVDAGLAMTVCSVQVRGGLRVAVLELQNRGKLAHLPWSPLRAMLNERQSFRTSVHAGTVKGTTIAVATAQKAESTAADAFLLDASFEGVGLLVDAVTARDLAETARVRIEIETETDTFEVIGTIRHRAKALRGARFGISAGGPGSVSWSESDEAALREFVVNQQREALSRRRNAG